MSELPSSANPKVNQSRMSGVMGSRKGDADDVRKRTRPKDAAEV